MSLFGKKKPKLGERQKKKIINDFNVFFDTKKAGKLTWEDCEQLQEYVLSVSGWQTDSAWWQSCQEFFKELYEHLLKQSTAKNPQHITPEDWLEAWISVVRDKQEHEKRTSSSKKKEKGVPVKAGDKSSGEKGTHENPTEDTSQENGTATKSATEAEEARQEAEVTEPEAAVELPQYFPDWLKKYFEYKFKLLDRADNGNIDLEEFEYVLWDGFGVSPGDCREAFKIMSEEYTKEIDKQYFLELFLDYFFSEDIKPAGNYINGKVPE